MTLWKNHSIRKLIYVSATRQICCWRVAGLVSVVEVKIMTATSSLKISHKHCVKNEMLSIIIIINWQHQIKNINFSWMMMLLLLLEYLECVWNVWTLSNNRKLINWYFIRIKTFSHTHLKHGMLSCYVWVGLDFTDERRGLNFCSFFYLFNLRQTSRDGNNSGGRRRRKTMRGKFLFWVCKVAV